MYAKVNRNTNRTNLVDRFREAESNVLKNKYIPTVEKNKKKKVYEQFPAFIYIWGAETWNRTKQVVKYLMRR